MKKALILLIGLFLLTSCKQEEKNIANGKELDLDIITMSNCDKEVREFVEVNGRKVYTVCISEIIVNEEDIPLSSYMKEADQGFDKSIEDLLTGLKLIDTYKDGGTKLYRNDEMTVITCNKMLENKKTNRDIYIGNKNLTLENGFCTREVEE